MDMRLRGVVDQISSQYDKKEQEIAFNFFHEKTIDKVGDEIPNILSYYVNELNEYINKLSPKINNAIKMSVKSHVDYTGKSLKKLLNNPSIKENILDEIRKNINNDEGIIIEKEKKRQIAYAYQKLIEWKER